MPAEEEENNVRHSRPQKATWGEKGMKQLTARRLVFVFVFGRATRHEGSQFPDQGSNPCPMQWKLGVLTTVPRGEILKKD